MKIDDHTTGTIQTEDDLLKEIERKNRIIAELREKDRLHSLKRDQIARLKKTAVVHPRDDADFAKVRAKTSARGSTGLVGTVMAHGGASLHAHFDPGPHPFGKLVGPGWKCTPAVRFEFDMMAAGKKHGRELPPEVVNDAAAAIEARVERRIQKIHDQVHRAINSIGFLILQEVGGREPKWWLLHNHAEDRVDEDSYDEGEESTDGTDGTSETSGSVGDGDEEEDDAPDEYYDRGVSEEDDEDGTVDQDDESPDDPEDEASDDDDEDDDQ